MRNSLPILGVLRDELQTVRTLLEIGSGSGYHAVAFAGALPHIRWQTSDLDENHRSISATLEQAGHENVLPPLALDVRRAPALPQRYDAVYSCNTAHIMSGSAVRSMFELVASALESSGKFCLYGPFARGGQFSTPSNAAFDRSLRSEDSAMGIRDLDELTRHAESIGLRRRRVYAMPSNNLLVVWQKEAANDGDS